MTEKMFVDEECYSDFDVVEFAYSDEDKIELYLMDQDSYDNWVNGEHGANNYKGYHHFYYRNTIDCLGIPKGVYKLERI